jgi:hypothetical protein
MVKSFCEANDGDNCLNCLIKGWKDKLIVVEKLCAKFHLNCQCLVILSKVLLLPNVHFPSRARVPCGKKSENLFAGPNHSQSAKMGLVGARTVSQNA